MQKNIKKILLIILFIIGLIILIYPIITNYIYERKVDNLETKFDNIITKVEKNDNLINLNNKF